jgi:malonate-semialdehyde dehydrogenase (acetylating)/methylmalonate-semialdehyde dehydrogenase
MGAAFGSAGERCMAISVAVPVTDQVADALIERLVPRIEALNIGPAADEKSEMGPLVTEQHLAKVRGYIAAGEQEGAAILVDGRKFAMDRQGYENGYYIGGTLIDRVTPDMRIWKEEIFGPVLSMVRRRSFEEALELIHAHEYANGVAVFTRDGDAARAFTQQVQVGMVGVNVPIPVPVSYHTFGGWKRSAFGDTNQHGPEGVRFWTKIKTGS